MEKNHEATRPDHHDLSDLWSRQLALHTQVFRNIILILLFNINIDLMLKKKIIKIITCRKQ